MGVFAGKFDGRSMTALLLSLALVVPLAAAQDSPEYEDHVVVVQFAPEVFIANKSGTTGLQEFDRRADRYGVYLIERVYPFLDYVEPTPKTRRNLMALRRTYYVRYHASAAPEQVAGDLAAAPGVVYAEPVLVNRTQTFGQRVDPNDPKFGEQTELGHLRLPEAWDEVKSEDGAPRVVIAIVDGGGEWRHEDLRANVWTNPGETPGNGIDDDGNGFIDDVHGVNFANGDDTDNDPTGLPQTPSNANHGTNSAGAASAVTDNNVGVAGAAWNADIMHINAGCEEQAQDGGICYDYEGVLYAAANGADIINASWTGTPGSDAEVRFLDETLNLATDMGALVVASAANNNLSNDLFRFYPARHPRVLSVGATQKNSRIRAGFSNYGKLVNVFAPGVSIVTTGSGNEYVSVEGTSFSSPLVAGVAALVKTRFPDMTPDALREQVRLSSENMDAQNPAFAGQLGRGYVNALAAIQEPTLPAVRLKRWNWTDRDGNREIASGDAVTITATVVNYLADASQLKVGIVGAEPYPFIDLATSEVNVGPLASGDSTEVRFEFTVATDAPVNQRVRFYTRIREGAHEDEADMLSFWVNRSLEVVHKSLSAFYTATGGDRWTYNDNWDITSVPSEEELQTWYGVGLNEGLLVGLSLLDNNLTGMLPPELGSFPQLQWLFLDSNTLTGSIPPELGSLSQLQDLYLEANSLTGAIPPELGSLSRLIALSLRGNDLTGTIPTELGSLSQLQRLWLWDNSLTGPIPSELGSLSQLEYLNLSNNTLTGPIPSELGSLSRLIALFLDSNTLTGPIPSELGSLSQLQGLFLSDNTLTGTIPTELGSLSQLQQLWLRDNSLTGPIPSELGSLSQLQGLFLSDNTLTGAIPSELGSLSQLQSLSLWGNSLTGPIPAELGSLSKLQFLYLGINTLTGPIPSELGNLSQLQSLSLWGNSLTGPIPAELGSLSQLQYLSLDSNTLTGPIPSELGSLSQLEYLYLPNNTLTGPIPSELGSLSKLQYLYLHDNMLTGMLPRSLTQLENLQRLRFGGQDLCAPADDAFQAWLGSIPNTSGPTCSGIHFADNVPDQSFTHAQPIAPLVLPEAIGGVSPIDYTLTPALPEALAFDKANRTISGTPTVVTPATPYTYKATGVDGSTDSLTFNIEVVLPVSTEDESLPQALVLHGNYPNPFRHSTRLMMDLPWPARVTVEVMDVMGRRVFTVPSVDLAAGWERGIDLSGASLSSGLYLYRVHASSPQGSVVHVGRFVRIR